MPRLSAWTKARRIAAACLFVAAAAAAAGRYYRYEYNSFEAKGARAARADYKKGIFMLRGHGLPSDCGLAYRELLKERFDITLYNQGCLVDYGEVEFDEGYNAVSQALLTKRFGRDIFTETRADACTDKRPPADEWAQNLTPREKAIRQQYTGK